MSAGKLTPDRIITVVRVWRNMWGNGGPGNTEVGSRFDQFGAEFAEQRAMVPAASQKQPVGRGGAQQSEEAQAMDQLADGIVDRHETFGVELAQWHMERPLSRREWAQAVNREIDTLADADAGVADE